jgi:5'-methylthioadenosine nucleosidase
MNAIKTRALRRRHALSSRIASSRRYSNAHRPRARARSNAIARAASLWLQRLASHFIVATSSPMSTPIKTIAVLFAMDAEAAPLIAHLALVEAPDAFVRAPRAPMKCYAGTLPSGTKVYVVCNGSCVKHNVCNVGTVGAALSAYETCVSLSPDVLVNAGTAGGFAKRGGAVGDVYLGTEFKNFDRRIPIPGYDAYGVGSYEACATPNLAAHLGCKRGVVCTGNSLDATETCRAALEEYGASVKEMEAAAIAHVAHLFDVPLIGVKTITDIVDGPVATQEEFLANLGTAAAALKDVVPKVIEFLDGKLVSEL